MATHSSTLAWRIPWTEEPGRLPSMGLHRVGHDWLDLAAAAAATKVERFKLVRGIGDGGLAEWRAETPGPGWGRGEAKEKRRQLEENPKKLLMGLDEKWRQGKERCLRRYLEMRSTVNPHIWGRWGSFHLRLCICHVNGPGRTDGYRRTGEWQALGTEI